MGIRDHIQQRKSKRTELHTNASAQAAPVLNPIARHYTEVARQAELVAEAYSDQDPNRAAEVMEQTDCLCSCDSIRNASDTFALYSEETLAQLPAGAIVSGRGCGDPIAQANLQTGERVLDLGSGGGIDALIAARLVGSDGYVYGLDMTPAMVDLARKNATDAQIGNVEFIEGDAQNIPLPDTSVDVVISNCVVNLCPQKDRVFAEMYRILRPGGRIIVSDIVAFYIIPDGCEEPLSTLTGCRNGITTSSKYAIMLKNCGFKDIAIEKKTLYTLEVLKEKADRKGLEDVWYAVRAHGGGSIVGSALVTGYVPDKTAHDVIPPPVCAPAPPHGATDEP